MIYSEYINPGLLKNFEKETGYAVNLELYEAQEEMIVKLQTAGTKKYDVIIASDVVIQQMIQSPLTPTETYSQGRAKLPSAEISP